MRVYVVLAAIMVTLVVLLTFQFVYQKYNIEQPLFKMYSQTKLVSDVKVEENGSMINVILEVKKTENLRDTYRELTGYTEQVVGSDNYKMTLTDKRTKALEEVYYESQFIIYEAMAKGDYTRMADIIRQNAAKAGAEARVFIDHDYIYIQLTKDKDYLYEIVSRQEGFKGSAGNGIGSDQG